MWRSEKAWRETEEWSRTAKGLVRYDEDAGMAAENAITAKIAVPVTVITRFRSTGSH
jgi:hypothetical protein